MHTIRKEILKLSQKEMADLTGVAQTTVSRWETGVLAPNRDEMIRIRQAAKDKGASWSDTLFFEIGESAA